MKEYFNKIKNLWMGFARRLGKINSIILLSLVYFLVIGCMALIAKLFRKDLLHKKSASEDMSYWQNRASSEANISRSRYQF
jgi:hypothetical protein